MCVMSFSSVTLRLRGGMPIAARDNINPIAKGVLPYTARWGRRGFLLF